MPLEDVNNAFWELIYNSWTYFDRKELSAIADRAMDSDSYSKGYQHLDRVYDQDAWDYPEPPVWDDSNIPYYRDDDEAMGYGYEDFS